LEKIPLVSPETDSITGTVGACEIAKLRLWLSLSVDEESQEHIAPLPNLDFRIIQGNSLIENISLQSIYDFSTSKEKKMISIFDSITNAKKEELKSLQKAYINTYLISEKTKLKKLIEKSISSILNESSDSEEEFSLDLDKNFMLWEIMFPYVFDKGGFDLVIGNPPYIYARSIKKDDKDYYKSQYELSDYQVNTYILFMELGDRLINKQGFLGYITPNNWMTIEKCESVRRFVLSKDYSSITNINDKTFKAAVDNSIVIFSKELSNNPKTEINEMESQEVIKIDEVPSNTFLDRKQAIISINLIKNREYLELVDYFEESSIRLREICDMKDGIKCYEVGRGEPILTKEMCENKIYHSEIKIDNTYIKMLDGKDISRYFIKDSKYYVKYGKNLAAPRDKNLFYEDRILLRKIPGSLPYLFFSVFLNRKLLNEQSAKIAKLNTNNLNLIDIRSIVPILNSSVLSFYLAVGLGKMQRGTFPQILLSDMKELIIPKKIYQKDTQKTLVDLYEKRCDGSISDGDIDDYVMNLFELDIKAREIITNFCFSN